jgi:hypothetical protein
VLQAVNQDPTLIMENVSLAQQIAHNVLVTHNVNYVVDNTF